MSDTPQRVDKVTNQPDQRSKTIILAVRKIMQQMDYHSRKLNKHYGLTVPQVICLYEIYENGMMTISSLSKRVYCSMSTLVGVIDRLEEKNLVSRTRDLKDRRSIYINITPKGKEFVQEAPYLLHNRLNENLQALTEQEQHVIANSLDLLINLLREI
ncbi:MarR family winged helix-turn-helix transcriptional regulator [Legionella saoudiensis]|uniref:MarR family winged helix-turn-helix transcriptional regulator n=1 Tax=Legionella saoudiensis TaxID=1750561 RepID=UPI000730425E|nr:MarR family transcriptional regulator [Legionella saoudiensis]